jgi:integrase
MGFRASALLSLAWEEVHFDRQTLTVRVAHANHGESRSVPMNNILTETLRAIRINGLCLMGPRHMNMPLRFMHVSSDHK